MSDIVEVSEALFGRLRPVLPDWSTIWYEPSPIPVPAVCVEGDPGKAADYAETWGNLTKWSMRIGLYVGAVDQVAAIRLLGTLTGTRGPILTALKDDDAEDALATISMQCVQATTLTGWRMIRRNNARYQYAAINVTVTTN